MRVILAYKNFAAYKHISHIGLGVSAMNTCKTLMENGIACEVWPILDANDLRKRLRIDRAEQPPLAVTHVVVSAPWIPTTSLNHLCMLFPHIEFAMNCHSNVGFLQADTNGVRLMKEAIGLEMGTPNFTLAANSEAMCEGIRQCFNAPCNNLPNLYFVPPMANPNRPLWNGGELRIGIFGATRPQKNMMSAVWGALQIASQVKAMATVHISSGRAEGGGDTIIRSVRALMKDHPTARLVEDGWCTWPQFRQTVASMHLLLQPSYTESFNMVTADGIAEGVPSVVSDAIEWAPKSWQAESDDVSEIAQRGRALLTDPHSPREGLRALRTYVANGLREWTSWLVDTTKPGM